MFGNLVLCLIAITQTADEPVFSGPQVGEKLLPFDVTLPMDDDRQFTVAPAATGADSAQPRLIVFMHEKTRPAFGMANVLLKLAAAKGTQKLDATMVYLAEDPSEASGWLKNVARNFPPAARVAVSSDGIEGPEAYGLNRKVGVTVLVAKGDVVTANFAMVQPSLEVDAPRIFKAIAEVLGEEQVAKVSAFTPQNKQGRMAREAAGRDAARPAQEQDPNLRPLLVPLIQKTATDDEVAAAAKKIEEYTATHADARTQVGDIARRIIAADKLANYGTAACQEYLKKWAKEFTAAEKANKSKE